MDQVGVEVDRSETDEVEKFREFDEKLLAEQHLFYDDDAAIMQNAREAQLDLDRLFEADIAGDSEPRS